MRAWERDTCAPPRAAGDRLLAVGAGGAPASASSASVSGELRASPVCARASFNGGVVTAAALVAAARAAAFVGGGGADAGTGALVAGKQWVSAPLFKVLISCPSSGPAPRKFNRVPCIFGVKSGSGPRPACRVPLALALTARSCSSRSTSRERQARKSGVNAVGEGVAASAIRSRFLARAGRLMLSVERRWPATGGSSVK